MANNHASPSEPKVKVIYNPNAGKKRNLVQGQTISLEDIKSLLTQYQIPADYFPTDGPGHASVLAQKAVGEGYKKVLAAGGDGTVSEVATGLINTDIALGILPLGSFMNTANMLSIPVGDLEKAIILIKVGRTRKIDIGQIVMLSGEKLAEPIYFIENSSIGIEAEIQHSILRIERGKYREALDNFRSLIESYRHKMKIVLDDQTLDCRVSMVSISNGPTTGAALSLAPKARLNDHLLTVSLFSMSRNELIYYFLKLMKTGKTHSHKITRYQSTSVKVYTRLPQPVHADAKVFGTTPVEYRIIPNALTVITGFPQDPKSALLKRTILDP